MTPSECASLLALAGAYDARLTPPSRADAESRAMAWSLALSDTMPLEWARSAVVHHYSEQTTVVMPADINRLWGSARRKESDKSRVLKQRLEIQKAKDEAVPMPEEMKRLLNEMKKRRDL